METVRHRRTLHHRVATAVGLTLAVALSTAAGFPITAQEESLPPPPLIPAPVSMQTTDEVFTLDRHSKVTVDPGAPAPVLAEAEKLAAFLRTATGFPLNVARQGWGLQD